MGRSILQWLKGILGHRWFPLGLGLLAWSIGSPSIDMGLQIDDFWHHLYFSDSPTAMEMKRRMGTDDFLDCPPMNMFWMFDGYPDQNRIMIESGYMPWWSAPDMKLGFLRPLSVLTHWPEYRMIPDRTDWMHIHNLIWYVLLCILVAILYRILFDGSWAAGLAGLVFVMHDSHAAHLVSISQRNALIGVFLGICSVLLFMRSRKTRSYGFEWSAIGVFCLSLLAADTGITTVAFLLAYCLFLDRSNWAEKTRVLLPYFVIALIWRMVNSYLGYGAFHNEMYIDPSREPMRIIGAIAERFTILFTSMIAIPPAEAYWFFSYRWNIYFCLITAGVSLVFLYVISPMTRVSNLARFWLTGALLAVVPVCAVTPDSRNLLYAHIGAVGLMIQYLSGWSETPIAWTKTWPRRISAFFFIGLFILYHLVLSPVIHVAKLNAPNTDDPNNMFVKVFDFGVAEGREKETTVVVVNPPSQFYTYYPAVQFAIDRPWIRTIRTLGCGTSDTTVIRTDDKTVRIRQEDGFFPPPGQYSVSKGFLWDNVHFFNMMRRVNRYYRCNAPMMPVGHVVQVPGLTVTVTDHTFDHRPKEAEFVFDVPLEDESLHWVVWSWSGVEYQPFQPPSIGDQVVIEADFYSPDE